MIIDTEKQTVRIVNIVKCIKHQKDVTDILPNSGQLMACNGVKGFGIVGPTCIVYNILS